MSDGAGAQNKLATPYSTIRPIGGDHRIPRLLDCRTQELKFALATTKHPHHAATVSILGDSELARRYRRCYRNRNYGPRTERLLPPAVRRSSAAAIGSQSAAVSQSASHRRCSWKRQLSASFEEHDATANVQLEGHISRRPLKIVRAVPHHCERKKESKKTNN